MDFDDGFNSLSLIAQKPAGDGLEGELRAATQTQPISNDDIVKPAHHMCVWPKDRARFEHSFLLFENPEHILFRSDVVNNGIKIYDLKVKSDPFLCRILFT